MNEYEVWLPVGVSLVMVGEMRPVTVVVAESVTMADNGSLVFEVGGKPVECLVNGAWSRWRLMRRE